MRIVGFYQRIDDCLVGIANPECDDVLGMGRNARSYRH
jgi:hypothetical protein